MVREFSTHTSTHLPKPEFVKYDAKDSFMLANQFAVPWKMIREIQHTGLDTRGLALYDLHYSFFTGL